MLGGSIDSIADVIGNAHHPVSTYENSMEQPLLVERGISRTDDPQHNNDIPPAGASFILVHFLFGTFLGLFIALSSILYTTNDLSQPGGSSSFLLPLSIFLRADVIILLTILTAYYVLLKKRLEESENGADPHQDHPRDGSSTLWSLYCWAVATSTGLVFGKLVFGYALASLWMAFASSSGKMQHSEVRGSPTVTTGVLPRLVEFWLACYVRLVPVDKEDTRTSR